MAGSQYYCTDIRNKQHATKLQSPKKQIKEAQINSTLNYYNKLYRPTHYAHNKAAKYSKKIPHIEIHKNKIPTRETPRNNKTEANNCCIRATSIATTIYNQNNEKNNQECVETKTLYSNKTKNNKMVKKKK